MPRFYSSYSKPSYDHLGVGTPAQIFASTYAKPTYGSRTGWWPERVNLDLIRLFEGRERLERDEAVEAFRALFAKEKHTPSFTADRAANALQWGVRLGLLTESVEGGRYVWTMPDRTPWFETDSKGRPRQVRGLPDGEQADVNRKRAAQAKARATIREREALARDAVIEALVNDLLIHKPDAAAPDAGIWREALPNAGLPQPIVSIRPMVLEAHHDMDPRDQKRWQRHLEVIADAARWETRHRPALPVQPATVEDDGLLAEDDAALAGL
ncbi:protein of unknown function [Methylorubrum extorquens DM4]|uniref:Uncharacterized protein n=1 Tax=Methylorubrum extorquens (strain DSM 6343 / CIP 106787 / DM4) TaxID=661410 RepID=C7CEN8_METED|nr:hypothetical protein [Methylorubrum extorquens]CAX25990.1 protein of unknown function [Methylorubrum extorquens DM4]